MKILNPTIGSIDAATAASILASAKENLAGIYPGYDFLKRHRGSDTADGTSSRFYGEDLPPPNPDDTVEIVEGNDEGSYVLVFSADRLIGNTVVPPTPVSGHVRIVEDEYGHGLQARPCDDLVWTPAAEKSVRTWCAALTPEPLDGETYLVLASAYPGTPDPKPDMTGLKDGDVIDAVEVHRRHLRVRA